MNRNVFFDKSEPKKKQLDENKPLPKSRMPKIVTQNEIENINYTHDIYKAIINKVNNRNKLKPFQKNEIGCSKFSAPSTTKELSKIYVVRNRHNSIVYVGKTCQSISSRLRQGLNPPPEKGYHGYPWQEKQIVVIHCFTVLSFTNDEIESTEAELVYLIRKETGRWPLYQAEIHFSNNEKAESMAERIFGELQAHDKRKNNR